MAGDMKRYSIGNIDPVVMCEEPDGDYVEYSDHAARLTALEQENKRLRCNMRETYEAMVTMRNAINEHIPMPSIESDLLSGPENSVYCSRIAQSVVAALTHEDKS